MTQWTLDQLAERVGAALSVDYDGQVSGRVREVPDQRAIRYYTTIGLVDRPAAMRGRTALYVRRHLLQLVAIKRLQASGLTLARIQRELAGATDGQLERVARVPPLDEPAASAPEPPLTLASRQAPVPSPRRRAFWKQTAQPARSGRRPPTAPAETAEALPTEAAGLTSIPAGVVVMQGVRLGDGVTLLLEGERALEADDLAAIRAAAGPLLDLVRRGRERS